MNKSVIYVFLAIGLFFSFSLVSASENKTEMRVDKKGGVHLVTVAEELRKATKEEISAYENPGKEIPINFQKVFEKTSFFYFSIKEQSKEAVVFRDNKLKITERLTEEIRGRQLAFYVILLLVSFLFMVISNFFYVKSKFNVTINTTMFATATATATFATFAATFAAFATAATATTTTATTTTATTAAATFAATFAFFATIDINSKFYKLFVVIFYSIGVIALFI